VAAPLSAKDEFARVLDLLNDRVVMGKAHLAIGRGLSITLTGDPVVAHVAPVFWGTTISSHLDAAQMGAFKLFDRQQSALTVFYLLELAKRSPSVFAKASPDQVAKLVADSESKINLISESVRQIGNKRNRVLAHSDRTVVTDPEKLARITEVTFTDLKAVFDASGAVLNDVSVAFRDASQSWPLIGGEDYETAIQMIVDAKHAQADAYEIEFGLAAPFPRPKTPRTLA
jgi:AbiU2